MALMALGWVCYRSPARGWRPTAARQELPTATRVRCVMGAEEGDAFGPLLRRLRLAAGLTQEALAARAGLSPRGVQDLERGVRRAPRKDTLELLARALQLSAPDRAALERSVVRRRRPVRAAAERGTPTHVTKAEPRGIVGGACEEMPSHLLSLARGKEVHSLVTHKRPRGRQTPVSGRTAGRVSPRRLAAGPE